MPTKRTRAARRLATPATAATTTTKRTAVGVAPRKGGAVPISDPPTAAALKLWLTLARAYQSAAELSRMDIAAHGLSTAEFSVLEALYHKGPMLLGDVQRKALVSSGGITFLVDRLVERGLVERQACPNDRRARYAALTPEGEALLRRVFPLHADAMREAMAGLTSAEQRTATQLLKRLGLAAAARAAAHPECRAGISGG